MEPYKGDIDGRDSELDIIPATVSSVGDFYK